MFGLDSGSASDSVMLVALDRVHQKIKLISLARDSYVFIPEFGSYATRVQAERALAAAWRPMDVHRVPVRS